MNILQLQTAAEQLRSAHEFTINPKERTEIARIHDLVLKQLRQRGVIVGAIPHETSAPSQADPLTPDPTCPHCEGKGYHGAMSAFDRCICTYDKTSYRHPEFPENKANAISAALSAAEEFMQATGKIDLGLHGKSMMDKWGALNKAMLDLAEIGAGYMRNVTGDLEKQPVNTSAPKHIACPKCGSTNQDNNIACWKCSTPIAKHRMSSPIMDEDDARKHDQRQASATLERNLACMVSDYENGNIAGGRLRWAAIKADLRGLS